MCQTFQVVICERRSLDWHRKKTHTISNNAETKSHTFHARLAEKIRNSSKDLSRVWGSVLVLAVDWVKFDRVVKLTAPVNFATIQFRRDNNPICVLSVYVDGWVLQMSFMSETINFLWVVSYIELAFVS